MSFASDDEAHAAADTPRRRWPRGDDERAGSLTPKRLSSSSLGSLTRNASLASLADVLNGNDERHGAALLRSALAAFLRGATVGGALKGGLGLLGLLAKLRSRKPVGGKLAIEAKAALRYALFLGTYASGFRLVEGALARTVKSSGPWRAAAAGLIVAPAFVIADSRPSASLSVYIALRAALLALRSAKRNTSAFSAPAGAALFEHGPVLSMCASASVLLHAWLLEPASLPATYVRFLDRHGGKGRAVVDALHEVTKAGSVGAKLPAVLDWYSRHQPNASAALAAVPHTCSHPCDIVHPGQGHLTHALLFALRGVPAAIPVYLPVYAVSAALVQRGNLVSRSVHGAIVEARRPRADCSCLAPQLKQPMRVLTRSTFGIIRSSAFLSSYCAIAWLSCCTVHNRAGCGVSNVKMSRGSVLLCAFPAGLATLIEKPSRRTELALFCTGHACQSLAQCAVQWGWVRPVKRTDVGLLMLSSSFIMHTFMHEPALFRSSFLNVRARLMGIAACLHADASAPCYCRCSTGSLATRGDAAARLCRLYIDRPPLLRLLARSPGVVFTWLRSPEQPPGAGQPRCAQPPASRLRA
jgi:hypothetical protein